MINFMGLISFAFLSYLWWELASMLVGHL